MEVARILLMLGAALALAGTAESYAQSVTVDNITSSNTAAAFTFTLTSSAEVEFKMLDDSRISTSMLDAGQQTVNLENIEEGNAYFIVIGGQTLVYVHPFEFVYPLLIRNLQVEKDTLGIGFAFDSSGDVFSRILWPDGGVPGPSPFRFAAGSDNSACCWAVREGVNRIEFSTSSGFEQDRTTYLQYTHPNTASSPISPGNDGPLRYLGNTPPVIADLSDGTPELPWLFPFEEPRNIRVDVSDPDPDDTVTVTTDRDESTVTKDEMPGRFNIGFTAGVKDYNVDTITITATDSHGFKDTVTAYYNITQINEFASPEFVTGTGLQLDINVTSHVGAGAGARIDVTDISGARLGEVERVDNQTVRYMAGDQNGADDFLIKVDVDGTERTVLARVTIDTNRPPVAGNTSEIVLVGQTVDIDLSGIISDPEDDPLTVSVPDDPALGTVAVNGTTVSYTAGAEAGSDTVGYRVSDGRGGQDDGIITITITIPPITVDSIMTTETTADITVTLTDMTEVIVQKLDNTTISTNSLPAGRNTISLDDIVEGHAYYIRVNDTQTLVYIHPFEFVYPLVDVTVQLRKQGDLIRYSFTDFDSDIEVRILRPGGLEISRLGFASFGHVNGSLTPADGVYRFRISNSPGFEQNMTMYLQYTYPNNATGWVSPSNDGPLRYSLPVNLPPVAGNTSEIVMVGQTVDIDLSGIVLDLDPLTVSVTGTPALGTVVVNGTTVSYTAGNETGTETISYQVDDGRGGTADGTITITVATNIPPEARNFAVTVESSGAFTVDLAGAGHISDTGQEADTLTVSVDQPALGTVSINGTIIAYNAGAGAAGQDTITYTVSDRFNETDSAVITVTILPAGPVTITAVDDDIATDAGAPVLIDVLANDMIAPAVPVELAVTRDAANGSATVGANNTILYSPEAGYQGADSFEYRVSAGEAGDAATVIIVVGQVANTAPVAADFGVTVEPSGNVTVDLAEAGHISDAEQSAGTLAVSLDAPAAQGNATVRGAVFEYQADSGAAGTEEIPYTVTDREGLNNSATITVTIMQAPPEPVLRAPDIDIEAIPGTLTSVQPDIGAGNTITGATGATKGSITEGFLVGGTIAYTANAGESGIDGITYTVSDGAGGTVQGTVYFYINAQDNERPTLETIPGMQTQGVVTFTAMADDGDDDSLTYAIRNAPEGATIDDAGAFGWNTTGSDAGDYIFNVIVHDDAGGLAAQKMAITVRDPANGDPTAPVVHRRTTSDTPILVTPDIRDPEGQPTGMILAVGAERGVIREGFLEANIIAYVPAENGTDIISYTTSDGAGGASTSTVYIHTGASADPDLDAIGVQRVVTSETLTFQASAEDADSSDTLYVMNGAPAGATLDETSGNFSWTPAASDAGDHTFTITVYDGQGGFDTEPVAISVSEPGITNKDPNIVDFDSAARQNNPRFIALQTSDPDGDDTRIILATNSTTGTVRQDSLQFGIITYVPQIDWNGTDTVTYVVSDGRGGASTGTIHIHVRDPANGEPVLDPVGNRQVSVPGTLTFNVTASDNEDDPLTYAIRNAPAGATMTPDGTFSWTPTSSDAGDHAFTVAVHDTGGGFATEDITVTVTDPASQNQNPTAPDGDATTAGERTIVFVDISDPDGDDVTIIAATGAIQGLVDSELLADAIIAYTPFEGAFGTETITYTVSDGRGGLAMGTVTVTINTP